MRARAVSLGLVFLMLLLPLTPAVSATEGRTIGTTFLWGEHAGGSSNDFPQGVDSDAAGNVYVCGYFYGTANFGNHVLTSTNNGMDVFVAKLTPTGTWEWAFSAGSTNSDQCHDIQVDAGGNATITGWFYSTINFGGHQLSSSGSYDAFVVRLDSSGGVKWATKAGGSSNDYGRGVAIDDAGNAYVAGDYTGSTIYFGSTQSFSCSSCYSEAFVAKLDTNGNWVWAKRMYGSYYEYAYDIDVTPDGSSVVAVGHYSYEIYIGGTRHTNYYSYDYHGWTASFDGANGNRQWSNSFGYSSYETYPRAVVVDSGGNATLCGQFYYRTTMAGQTKSAYSGSNWDVFVGRFTNTGGWSWASTGGSTSTEECWGVDLDEASGESVVSIRFYNTAYFGSQSISSVGNYDAGLVRLDANGGFTWAEGFGSTSSDNGKGVTLVADNPVTVFSYNGQVNEQGTTLSHSGSNDIGVLAFGVDTDGDGIGDSLDAFPWDDTQWADTDGDGFGDELDGFEGDDCPTVHGNSTVDLFGCPDTDGDGWSDINDLLPLDPSQWEDEDGDGFGENPLGTDPDECPFEWGTSWRDRYGCRDLDGDGTSDLGDDFFNNPTQWRDSDSDGKGDNWAEPALNDTRPAHWPGQWVENATLPDPSPLDHDDDGFEDPNAPNSTTPHDDCIYLPGNSYRDAVGCPDADGDGWSDEFDQLDDDPTQHVDEDGDGFGDDPEGNTPDGCTDRPGDSFRDMYGCPDNDHDGLSNDADDCPQTYGTQPNGCPDTDGDGFVDAGESGEIDDCPAQFGDSTLDRKGCPDADGDGWSDENDPFPLDPTQWLDEDEDGWGDNPEGVRSDDCLNWAGTSSEGGLQGCPDADGDGWADSLDPWNANAALWSDSDGDGWADQQGEDESDHCPLVFGQSTLGFNGCPDADGDGWPDTFDLDIDGDGYTNEAELTADPPSDPFDADSRPSDADGDYIADHEEVIEKSSVDDPVMQGVLASVSVLILFAAFLLYAQLTGRRGQARSFDEVRGMIDEAEGFDGLAEVEKELDTLLQSNRLGAGQGMLLKDRLEARRFRLEDDLSGSQMSAWFSEQTSAGAEVGVQGETKGADAANADWTAEQQAEWEAQAKQWGGYYDHAGNWVTYNG